MAPASGVLYWPHGRYSRALLAPTAAHAAPAPHPLLRAPGDTITLPVRDWCG
ncbi:hypothetical protein [Streptomyces avermitilis]|uniref:hypothetical protein n=1 Tax=Streptomyces avermitilis TaxID=33903 RepID=UPI0033F11DE7